jgi:iron complex outermembrane receptor protein
MLIGSQSPGVKEPPCSAAHRCAAYLRMRRGGATSCQHLALKHSVFAVGLTLASPAIAFAQQVDAEGEIQKVFITGSNIKRAGKESASPVVTMSARQIADTGANTVAELLQSIPAFGSGASVDITDGGFSRGAATASLRGLGSSSTLILLNGRRLTASAYADPNQGKSTVYDLNAIPISAIERIEIFKDGASAVYGSDAIAGVINFITKTDYKGGELSASISANDEREFGRRNASALIGVGNLESDRYNAFIAVDVARRNSTLIKDEHDIEAGEYADINSRLNAYSSPLSDQPFFYRERTPGAKDFANSYAARADIINRTDCPASQQIIGNRAAHNLAASDPLLDRTFCNYNQDDFSEVQSAGTDANALARVTFRIAPNLTSFTELGFSRSERTYLGAPRAFRSTSPSTVFAADGSAPSQFQVILPVGHPDNPFPASRAAVGYRFVNRLGGADNLNESLRLVTGLSGRAGRFDWETAALLNRSERTEHYYGMLYKPTLARIMTENRTLAATAADPTATRDLANEGYAQVAQLDAKASTALGTLAGGDIGLAFGAEMRQEKIGLTPDQATQCGDIVGLSNSSADGERKVRSAFVELRTPFSGTFEMDFAGRVDKYPNLKTSFVPKVGAKWELGSRVMLRSAYSEGFRAPALTQVSPGGVQSFATVVDSLRCPDGVNPVSGAGSADCRRGISSVSSATPDLKPETAKSFSFGAILNPTRNLEILVDYYRIRKQDETALLSPQFIIDHPEQYPGRVIRDNSQLLVGANGQPIPDSGPISQVNRAYVNQGSTEISGIDVEIAYRKALGQMGSLSANLDYSYTLSFRRAERPGDAETNVAGTAGAISDWATSVGDIARHKARLSAHWTRGPHWLSGSVDFVSAISLLRRSDNHDVYPEPFCQYGAGQPASAKQLGGMPKFSDYNNSCEVKSWTTVGVAYAYTGIKDLTLAFNIRNLFDVAAPYDPRYPVEGFNSQLHNGVGRYFKVSATYKFK